MDFRKEYEQKLTTPEEAAKVVKSGDWIDYGHASTVPTLVDRAIAARAEELEDINIRALLVFHPLAIYEANERVGRKVFTMNSWHFGGTERKRAAEGDAFFIPMRFYELPYFYRREDEVERVDVAVLAVSTMDENGNFSFGMGASHSTETVRRAKYVILEENPNIPHTFGLFDDVVNIRDVDAVVKSDAPMDVMGNSTPSETDKKIADLIIPMIPSGATIQIGIGGLPDAVGAGIVDSDLHDLGVHTEMYVDSMVKMAKAGKITGKYKTVNRGKQVFAFGAGSQEMYDYVDHNPAIATASVDYVNDPKVIMAHDNFISINTAIQVDLMGQVSAESTGFRHISGTGGQLDFVIGAYRSNGGKSIVALNATHTDKKGNVTSNIVQSFKPGTIVTDPRSAVHYIATEYGIYNFKGKSTWQRAEALVNLAHPDFRDELIQQAEEMGIWRQSNKR
ncbi:MAG: acetyl-CoA hydrolase/transferase C-terminal domain-containing protein [Peptoniphilaceae bacterium]|nr:acetyl-CoA hydrolase/transferase C-terminal domain-containing protein [Peptoniphilaceae bacterium]MDY6085800.1 acetyl-CoA hydrolase/transferase C-terminal domain-containing protein [Peptoniphilaceae bacterium]